MTKILDVTKELPILLSATDMMEQTSQPHCLCMRKQKRAFKFYGFRQKVFPLDLIIFDHFKQTEVTKSKLSK